MPVKTRKPNELAFSDAATSAPPPTTVREPTRVRIAGAPAVSDELIARLAKADDLGHLVSKPPVMQSAATARMDGRKEAMALVVGRESDGRALVGGLVHLYEGDKLVDECRLDGRGLALVRFPQDHDTASMAGMSEHAAPKRRAGTIRILVPGHDMVTKDVATHTGKHAIVDVTLRARRTLHVDGTSGHATSAPTLPPTDNVLDHLPAEFDTRLCRDLQSFFTQTPLDPATGVPGAPQLLPAPNVPGLVPGSPDFRQQRLPIVKRFSVVRQGTSTAPIFPTVPPDRLSGISGLKLPDAVLDRLRIRPRKYIVRMRQEWVFLGYSLGPMIRVDALDPGSIVNDATRTVDRALQTATREVDRAIQSATRDVDSLLRQRSTLDNVVSVATTTSAGAIGGGLYIGVPGFGFGIGGGAATASANVTTTTKTDASLSVSNSLHVAANVVNEAVATVEATRRELQNVVAHTLGQVSPLLTRVTNLMRWRMMENYLVCTHVEDVLELTTQTIAELPDPATGLLFTPEQIVDLARVFKPGLLEPRLAPRFESLAEAVDAARAGAAPIVSVDVTVEYASPASYSSLRVSLGGAQAGFELVPGGSSATRTIYFPAPLTATALTATATLALGLSPEAGERLKAGTQVARIELAFRTASGQVRRTEIGLGGTLFADADHPSRVAAASVQVPQPATGVLTDPLVAHINANRAHYFGLLCLAALHEPALRDDLPHFAHFRAEHPLWGLPIIGFEGNRAVIVKPADTGLEEVKLMLADPGTATLVQLNVAGAYAEALQGLLQLAIGEGLHPALLAPLPPVLPPLAIVPVPISAGSFPTTPPTPTPTPTPVPLPSP